MILRIVVFLQNFLQLFFIHDTTHTLWTEMSNLPRAFLADLFWEDNTFSWLFDHPTLDNNKVEESGPQEWRFSSRDISQDLLDIHMRGE